jgi:glycosyltransferase involved in cell wall biosynthesis|uniref:Glycosyltransferase n=1 Tax=Fervidicoccus fontis TaxID=683846 RepID=A0A7J3SKQ6_9CREN
MSRKAIVVSRGLHPPWNMGEVVLARNFTKILAELYDEVNVFSTIDEVRGSSEGLDIKPPFDIKFYSDEERLKIAVLDELSSNPYVDIHLINTSLVKFLNVTRRASRAYFYQFAYNIFNDPNLILHSIGALPLTYLSNIKIITTSPYSYIRFHKFFRRNYYYIPAPIESPVFNEKSGLVEESDDRLKIFYLGHGSYLRFPYDKVLKAISRLKKERSNIELNLYISKQGYADYAEFTVELGKTIKKLSLEKAVKIHLRNLSEDEKWSVICENHVLLFPSLTNAAIDPPIVILEAMFMGKCIIATPIQSIPYLLGGGRGVIVDRWNLEDSIYKALRILEGDRKLLEEYGVSSKKWVAKTHNMGSVCNRIGKILDEP